MEYGPGVMAKKWKVHQKGSPKYLALVSLNAYNYKFEGVLLWLELHRHLPTDFHLICADGEAQ